MTTMTPELLGSLFFVIIIILTLLRKIQLLEIALKVYLVLLVVWFICMVTPPLQHNWVYPLFDMFMRGSLWLIVQLLSLLGFKEAF